MWTNWKLKKIVRGCPLNILSFGWVNLNIIIFCVSEKFGNEMPYYMPRQWSQQLLIKNSFLPKT